MKKFDRYFELTDEFKINDHGVKLFRIKCVKKLRGIKVETLGGWIEKVENLSEMAWVGDEAEVFGNAIVYGRACICGHAKVHDNAKVFGYAIVTGNASIFGEVEVYGYACIFGYAIISGNTSVFGHAHVFGHAKVDGYAIISGKARVSGHDDYCCFQSFGSKGLITTVFREVDNGLRINSGCFSGTLKEFEKRLQKTRGDNKYGKEYKVIIEVIKTRFAA